MLCASIAWAKKPNERKSNPRDLWNSGLTMITLHKTNISHQTGKGKSSSKGALRGEYLSSQEGNFIQFQQAEVPIPRTTHQPNGLCIKHIVNSKIKLPTSTGWLDFWTSNTIIHKASFSGKGGESLKDVGIPCRKVISGPQSAGMSFQSSLVSQFNYKHSIAYVQICACTLRINLDHLAYHFHTYNIISTRMVSHPFLTPVLMDWAMMSLSIPSTWILNTKFWTCF